MKQKEEVVKEKKKIDKYKLITIISYIFMVLYLIFILCSIEYSCPQDGCDPTKLNIFMSTNIIIKYSMLFIRSLLGLYILVDLIHIIKVLKEDFYLKKLTKNFLSIIFIIVLYMLEVIFVLGM